MTEKPFRVMLAANLEKGQEGNLIFPLIASPKIDGVRMYIKNGIGYSRSNKPIPNEHVQRLISAEGNNVEGLDGELVVGNPNDPDVYNKTSGAVRRKDGEPDVRFYVFDSINDTTKPFKARLSTLPPIVFRSPISPEIFSSTSFTFVLVPKFINSLEELLQYEQEVLALGFEGVILRSLDAPYKNGRSTVKEQGMLKLKRFSDAEAVIIGTEELMHNNNQAMTNELGLTERSSHKENLEGGNKLGALVCKTSEGVEFKIGTGFTDSHRRYLWSRRDELIGQFVKYKYFSHGIKEAPRHPVFLGFRETWDI